MNKNILPVVGITVLLMGTFVTPSFAIDTLKITSVPISNGNTFYVGGSGQGNYTHIQDAVENTTDGDTVFVYNGTYYERVKIYTSINLIGENRENTIIDASTKHCPIWIGANYVTVSGFTTQNSGDTEWHDSGVHIGYFDYGTLIGCNIIGNKMINNFDGMYLLFPEIHNIEENIIINNRHHGITLHGSGSGGCVSIINNTIVDNYLRGICIYDPSGNVISGNIILNNGDEGIFSVTSYNQIFQNIIKNHTYGIKASGSFNKIHSNIIEKNDFGIFLGTGHRSTVKKNNFIDNDCHATFDHLFLRPTNRWSRNYWDNHLSFLPKIILGKSTAFTWLTLLLIILILLFGDYPYEEISGEFGIPIPWIQFDWFPAREQYDI